MRAVLQRVKNASVSANEAISGSIGRGFLVLLGVETDDSASDIAWLVDKIMKLRVFDDADGRMNLSIAEMGGEVLVVSQFTLFGTTKKGARPSFHRAAPPAVAEALYRQFTGTLAAALARPVPTGIFGAMMAVELVNDGPVTLVLDSRRRDF
ncbi:MAG: D-tyrosyl-tRNA(Tyr) deacylase [Puniceicoccales bacterium]|nr:D-tyrosyl-tRNA(Tyr) deacylase [Puniceicoccales bacterium]